VTSSTTAAVIIKVEGATLRILDQNGTSRVVSPQQVTLRRENKNFAVASDSSGNDIRVGDAMKESDGEVSYCVPSLRKLAHLVSIGKERLSISSARFSFSCTTGNYPRIMGSSSLVRLHWFLSHRSLPPVI